ncbi:Brix domain-containing protein [Sphaceloma murrayae]|uniref:Brix domain-containing protein n=1 Tax=Sphaceloma murrayae TaxID=2082308 RepID=A0A2K1QTE8_9PEZI|nr:Brix domain-containing protein [Sphaceloma murrayae]
MGFLKDPHHIPNKLKRSEQLLKFKKAKESAKRDERLRRRRTEDKNPKLREERRAQNVPATIDSKRVWDDVDGGDDLNLNLAVDLQAIKRRRVEAEESTASRQVSASASPSKDEGEEKVEEEPKDDDMDSMLGSDSDEDEDDAADSTAPTKPRAPSPAPSTATDLNLTPENLQSRFPSLFAPLEHAPKVLITTSINSRLKAEAQLLTSLFPNSHFVPRNTHFHSHKYSVREIASFASNRNYTCLVILNEDLKRPSGLDVVHLPNGPMFHFSISNWIEGKRLPGHGNPTGHDPELILNGFRTPLGLLTAHLFRTLFPPQPELQGRTVVTLHNQRDYIFVRRHRYIFRDKRGSEKSVQGADGKPIAGVEDVRTGLQELGPRFTLKLRRIDRGIQRTSGQEWEWKGKSEKVRTRFQL